MSAERLLREYSRIAEAPNSVSHLRRFILNLAIRGKLLATKDAWSQVTLGDLGEWGSGGTPLRTHPEYYGGNIPWLVIGDLNDSVVTRASTHITEEGLKNSSAKLVEPGTLLIAMYGSIGKLGMAGIKCATNQAIAFCIPDQNRVCREYLFLLLRGLREDLARHGQGVAQQNISQKILKSFQISLPSVAEQSPIVAKVDELMALCDQLENARAERETRRDKLTAATLACLNTPNPETFRNDARFVLGNLQALTTRPDQVSRLRQSILRLALDGKLVSQNTAHKPATDLLALIESKRDRLLRSGYPNLDEARAQTKKQSAQVVPTDLKVLPNGWSWATLLQCSLLVIDCKNKTAPYSREGIRLVRTTNVRNGRLNQIDQKYVDQRTYEMWSTRCTPEGGDILVTREAPMGEVCLIPDGERVCLGQRMMLARLVPHTIDPAFMLYSLRDPQLMDRVQDKPIGATVQHLRVGGVETLLIPVPPLEEQKKIVAKLDELMKLCDRLEASLAIGEQTRRRLLEAILAEALQPKDDSLEERQPPEASIRLAS